ncbi:hypothetical protein MBTS_08775 [Methylobacterium bullatum]|nr:hypothetical protein [Methylobacterium bullatum]
MPITKRQLAASLLSAPHIEARALMARFVQDEATRVLDAPFSNTCTAVLRQVWGTRGLEFRATDIQFTGLAESLRALQAIPAKTPLVQEILRAGPHTLYVFHHGDGCQIVGAVLHGKPNIPLPDLTAAKRGHGGRRTRPAVISRQLDLFSAALA